ncbi:hypothetical protein SCAR479_08576 [Seiridium cardinale]|uniref:DUF4378 domain-containing protein n=1 Tax=Seiridium cardinale TaxID=138064 RepID=A0ABR2XLV6_9PEZI
MAKRKKETDQLAPGKRKEPGQPHSGPPKWGEGNSQGARKRRRLREAQEASERQEHSVNQGQQETLDYGASSTQRRPLTVLPSVPNHDTRASAFRPPTKIGKIEVIDLTGNSPPRNLTRKSAPGAKNSNWRPVAGNLPSKTENPEASHPVWQPVVLDVNEPITFSIYSDNLQEVHQDMSLLLPKTGRPLHLLERKQQSPMDTTKLSFSFGQDIQYSFGFDVAAQKYLEKSHDQAQKTSATHDDMSISTCNTLSSAIDGSSTQPKVAFGQPQKPMVGFDRLVWKGQDPEPLVDWTPIYEKSLEDLYEEHPDKRLRGIEPKTLDLVAKTVQQIASEAANDWLKSSCPRTRWCDKVINVEGLYDFNAPELDYTILDRALSLQGLKNTITSLLVNSRAMTQGTKNMTPLILVRVIDQSIAVCLIAKDAKRRVLLEKTKAKVEWLPVGLDCKKLDIQRRAIQSLEEHYTKTRKELALDRPTERASRCSEWEIQILDHALVEFQEYRLEFLIDMLRTLEQLLEATAY